MDCRRNEKNYAFYYTIEELKWDILILRWSGIGNDLKGHPVGVSHFNSSPV